MKSIIFSKEMITAILEGRKTQTRRVIKEPRLNNFTDWDETRQGYSFYTPPKKYSIRGYYKGEYGEVFLSPKYFEDETIYVKEKYFPYDENLNLVHSNKEVIYEADFESNKLDVKWKNPIFMPEKYSRIKLKITSIKVQKLKDISEDDCIKEGILYEKLNCRGVIYKNFYDYENKFYHLDFDPKDSYRTLINSIYKKDIWSENPFVFVYDFEVI